ncbi:hypothetical protein, partial [Xylanibacter rodentium]|uniref:hypothetical protein n=1 Tax=Xylanibacter rodentium TaxID=2736289 RepID=UPI00259908D9
FYVAVCFHRCDFFYLYITFGFRLLDISKACGEQRGCSPFGGKIRVQNEVFAGACGGKYHFVSGNFSAKRQKNIPGTARSPLASKLKIVVD